MQNLVIIVYCGLIFSDSSKISYGHIKIKKCNIKGLVFFPSKMDFITYFRSSNTSLAIKIVYRILDSFQLFKANTKIFLLLDHLLGQLFEKNRSIFSGKELLHPIHKINRHVRLYSHSKGRDRNNAPFPVFVIQYLFSS